MRKRERIGRRTGRRQNGKIRRAAEKSEESNRRSKEERWEGTEGEESDNLPKI